jgi:bacterioferritin (cytochrome b1)
MDVEKVLEGLNHALSLQHRSVLQLSLAGASIVGLAAQALAPQLAEWAGDELRDARLIVEKIAGLGGAPTTEVAPLEYSDDARRLVGILAGQEGETLAALHAVIPDTGQQPRSEALEHMLEHLIMRKQHQLDLLHRIERGL